MSRISTQQTPKLDREEGQKDKKQRHLWKLKKKEAEQKRFKEIEQYEKDRLE